MPPLPEALVAIVGPTATGKSALAVQLAVKFDGEVINADSRQVYRGMDIGTAKPRPEERARVPHHLYDVADPGETFSLALFLQEARRVIADCHVRGRLPILAGGTGQYAWGLLEGWNVPEVAPQGELRRELTAVAAASGPEALFEQLRAVDPIAAASIDPRNVRRVVRALEVYQATGRPFSDLRQKQPPRWRTLILGVDLPDRELDRRIEERVDAMLAAGFADEVRRLLASGVPRSASAMASIGYPQLVAYLDGECSLDEARAEIVRATRRLVRRQWQWFRRNDTRITWVGGVEEAHDGVAAFLAGARW